MRLKSVFISQYKNLRNFDLTFDGTSFIDVFVGKNGSGKSNLFEALIEIFRHLDDSRNSMAECNFEYRLSYEIEGSSTTIEWKDGNLSIDGRSRRTSAPARLPDNILIYYSGHNDSVPALVQKYEDSFRKRLKDVDMGQSRLFIGVGSDYKKLLLAVLLLQAEEISARSFICHKLGIRSVGETIRLTLGRPHFATSRLKEIAKAKESDDETIDAFDPRTHYWGALGIVRLFLEQLVTCVKGNFQHEEIYYRSKDQYILNLDTKLVIQKLTTPDSGEMFRAFDNLKTVGMLKDISMPLILKNGMVANLDFFSDGQFQTAYIYAIAELFKNTDSLTLLDEPDAFLHPEWQFDFLKQVLQISDIEVKRNHFLLSSHSAVTLIPHESDKVRFVDIKNNAAHCYEVSKRIAIQKLSDELIRYSEQEKLLSIFRTIQIKKKPVLFTEGHTDALILNEAWHRLYGKIDIPFIPFYAFSHTYIKQLLTDDRIYDEMGKLPVFCLFDFDEAFNSWNGLKGEVLQEDPFIGLIKKCENRNSYAIMLPLPRIEAVIRQTIKNRATGKTFGGASHCCIEHLFYGIPETDAYFEHEPCPGGSKIVFRSDGFKTAFAEEVVQTLPNASFRRLKPVFDFIVAKCRELKAVGSRSRAALPGEGPRKGNKAVNV